MAEATLPHDMPALYEPSLFGTYSKKNRHVAVPALGLADLRRPFYAYSYGRISTPNWPEHRFLYSASIANATIMTAFLLTSSLTMVLFSCVR